MKRNIAKLYFVCALVILAFVLRLVNLNQSFWLDEAAQVIESARPFSDQFKIAADFHPPLYHVLLHFWMIPSHGESWIRLLSVLLGTGCVFITAYLVPKKNNTGKSLLAAFFLSISPYHIWYSQEARPYMLFVFLTLLSSFFLLRKKWIWYLISVVFLIYSLYFWPFVLFAQGIWIFFKERASFRAWIIVILSSLVFYIPWIPSFLQQLQIGTGGIFTGWTSVVSYEPLKAIVLMFAKFIFGKGTVKNHFIYALILIPVLIFFFRSLLIKKEERDINFTLVFFVLSLFSSFIISFFIPILAPQRLLFLIPFFYMIMADGLLSVKMKMRSVGIFLVCAVSIGGLIQYYVDPEVQREDWRSAVSFIENDDVSLERVALFVFPDPFAPYLWYQTGKLSAYGIAPHFILTQEDLIKTSPYLLAKNRVYLFQYLTGLTDPGQKTREYLSVHGFENTDTKNYPGVGFIYIYDRI